MRQIKVGGFRRISKAAARKEYEKGNDVFLLACKLSPSSPWYYPVRVNNYGRTFEAVCNEFSYYNCNNELGSYPAFYTFGDN